METTTNQDVIVYTSGLCFCSVCAPSGMPLDDVLQVANIQNPTGLAHGWSLDAAPTFKGGEPNPCTCNRDASRKHYLLSC